MKTNSNQFGKYVHTGNNYNSMIDEYRRNKILYASKKFKINENELFLIMTNVIKKTFRIRRDLEDGLEFKFKQDNITLNYEFEKYSKEDKEIIITWKVDKDQYWLYFKVKKGMFKSKINYKQVIFRDKTFFGFQDQVGLFYYKMSFKKNVKQFNNSIKHLKNNPE
ncbi:MAG: hypothetical protein ACRCUM_01045 [Mycoplasmoidaceae bacterium]